MKKNFRLKNKGELTTQQIVTLVIAITSFAVLLFLFVRLDLGQTTDEELCHNSVVMRGSSVISSDAISLNCNRKYICITSDGTCEQMTNPDLMKVESKNEVYNILAEEMAICWWMYGEGKINYVGEEFISDLYCSICNQIAFDNSLEEEIFPSRQINEREFYRHLAFTNVSGKSINYLDYLYGIGDIGAFEQELNENNIQFRELDLSKQHYLVMGIHSEISLEGWVFGGIIGAAVVAGAITFLPVTIVASTSVLATVANAGILVKGIGAGVGYLVGTSVEGLSGNEYLATTLLEVNSEDFEKLECDSISNRI